MLRRSAPMKAETCAFPDCPKRPRSGSEPLCEGHYYQRRRGTPLRPLQVYRNERCMVEGCERPPSGKYCSMHDARIRRHGDPDVAIPQCERAIPKGPNHPRWQDEPTYSAVHQRVRKRDGKASDHTCRCGAPARHWAYIGPRAPEDRLPYRGVDDYEAMCTACHKRMDMAAIRGEAS